MRSVQKRQREALSTFNDYVAAVVIDSVEERGDAFNTASIPDGVGVGDEANIGVPGHPSQKCRSGSRAGARDVPQVAGFGVTVFLADECGAGIDDDPVSLDAQHIHFAKEHRFVNNAASSDTVRCLVGFGAARHLAHDDIFSANRNRMARIWSPASNEPGRIRGSRQECHDFAFTFRTVLSSDYNGCGHNPFRYGFAKLPSALTGHAGIVPDQRRMFNLDL